MMTGLLNVRPQALRLSNECTRKKPCGLERAEYQVTWHVCQHHRGKAASILVFPLREGVPRRAPLVEDVTDSPGGAANLAALIARASLADKTGPDFFEDPGQARLQRWVRLQLMVDRQVMASKDLVPGQNLLSLAAAFRNEYVDKETRARTDQVVRLLSQHDEVNSLLEQQEQRRAVFDPDAAAAQPPAVGPPAGAAPEAQAAATEAAAVVSPPDEEPGEPAAGSPPDEEKPAEEKPAGVEQPVEGPARDFAAELGPLMSAVQSSAGSEPVERLREVLEADAALLEYFVRAHQPVALAGLHLARFLHGTPDGSDDSRRAVSLVAFLAVRGEEKFFRVEEYLVGTTTLHTLHALLRLRFAVADMQAAGQQGLDGFAAALAGKCDHWRKTYGNVRACLAEAWAVTQGSLAVIQRLAVEEGDPHAADRRVGELLKNALRMHDEAKWVEPDEEEAKRLVASALDTATEARPVLEDEHGADLPARRVADAFRVAVRMSEHAAKAVDVESASGGEVSLLHGRHLDRPGLYKLVCVLEARLVVLGVVQGRALSLRAAELRGLLANVDANVAEVLDEQREALEEIADARGVPLSASQTRYAHGFEPEPPAAGQHEAQAASVPAPPNPSSPRPPAAGQHAEGSGEEEEKEWQRVSPRGIPPHHDLADHAGDDTPSSTDGETSDGGGGGHVYEDYDEEDEEYDNNNNINNGGDGGGGYHMEDDYDDYDDDDNYDDDEVKENPRPQGGTSLLDDDNDAGLDDEEQERVAEALEDAERLRLRLRELRSRQMLSRFQLLALGEFELLGEELRRVRGLPLMQMTAVRSIVASARRMVSLLKLQLRVGIFGVMRAGKTSFVCALVGSVFSTIRERATTALPLVVIHDPSRRDAGGPELRLPARGSLNKAVWQLRAALADGSAVVALGEDRVLLQFAERVAAGSVAFEAMYQGVEAVRDAMSDCNDLVRMVSVLRYRLELPGVANLGQLVSDPDMCPQVRVAFRGLDNYTPVGELAIIDTPGSGESAAPPDSMLAEVAARCSKHVVVVSCKMLGADAETSVMGILRDNAGYPPDVVLNQKDLNHGDENSTESVDALEQDTRVRYARFHPRAWSGVTVTSCSAFFALNAAAARAYMDGAAGPAEPPRPCHKCHSGEPHACKLKWLPSFAKVAFGQQWRERLKTRRGARKMTRAEFDEAIRVQFDQSGIGAATRAFVTGATQSASLNTAQSALRGSDKECKEFVERIGVVRRSNRTSVAERQRRICELEALMRAIPAACDTAEGWIDARAGAVKAEVARRFQAFQQSPAVQELVKGAVPDRVAFASVSGMEKALSASMRSVYDGCQAYIRRKRGGVDDNFVRPVVDSFRCELQASLERVLKTEQRQAGGAALELPGLAEIVQGLGSDDKNQEADINLGELVQNASSGAKKRNTKTRRVGFLDVLLPWRWFGLDAVYETSEEHVLDASAVEGQARAAVVRMFEHESRQVVLRARQSMEQLVKRSRVEIKQYITRTKQALKQERGEANRSSETDQVLEMAEQRFERHRARLREAIRAVEGCQP